MGGDCMNDIAILQKYIDECNNIVFFGGAGVSTESGIKDFQVIPFSIGNVFASKICEYDDSFVYDVLDTLLYKTPAIRGGILWK